MTNFVLVAGAWLGSWAWNDVLPDLRADGHAVHPLTLSGLADKQGVAAGQQTHVEDIVDYVERLDLHDVVLVGHSYSGIPAGQAAERIGDRLARVVFVDSNVPADGESFVSGWPEGRPRIEAAIAANDGFWPPPTAADFAGQGLGDEEIARIVAGRPRTRAPRSPSRPSCEGRSARCPRRTSSACSTEPSRAVTWPRS